MNPQEYDDYADSMRRARRAVREPLETMLQEYTSPAAKLKNPWHKFLHIRRFDNGFEFFVFDGSQSPFSTEPSPHNMAQRLFERAIKQFLKKPDEKFFRRSDKKFYIKVNSESLKQGENAVRYSIIERTREFARHKGSESELERVLYPSEDLHHTIEFLKSEMQEHVARANEARNRGITMGVVAGVLAASFMLVASCPNDKKPGTPVKHAALSQQYAQSSPASPEHNL